MIGKELTIRSFTPVTGKIMNLIPGDIGRPITDIKSNLKVSDLKQKVGRVIDTLEILETDIDSMNGKRYSMKIRPYRTFDNKIDGVVLVLVELDSEQSGS